MAKDAVTSALKNSLRIVSLQKPDSFSPWRELPAGQYSVGGSLTNDIAVAGIPTAELFILTVEQTAFNKSQLTFTPLIDGLDIEGRVLAIGEPVILQHFSVVTGLEHRFEISSAASGSDVQTAQGDERNTVAVPGRGSFPVLSGVALRNGKNLSDGWQTRAKGASRLLAAAGFLLFAGFASLGVRSYWQTNDRQLTAIDPAGVTIAADASIDRLRSVLFSLDLAQLVKIDQRSGRIRLSGELTEEQAARLKIALVPFGSTVLTSIRFKPNANHGVAGVFLKPRAFVIATDGRLVALGGMLKSGWRIDQIARNGVSLSKNGQSLIAPVGDENLVTGSIKAGKNNTQWQMRGTVKAGG